METLRMGPESISANGQAMGVWSSETILQLSEASDAIKVLQNKFTVGFGVMAQVIMPVIKTLEMLSEQIGFAIVSAGELMKGDLKGAMAVAGAALRRRAAEVKPQPARVAAQSFVSPEEEAKIVDEKKKQDKTLFDEELYDLQEQARTEADRDKTLFDRLMRDAEFARDEKKRILALEKETAEKNKEIIMRGMEASGTILDKVRASAERLGLGGLVRQIDVQRQAQQRQTDVAMIGNIGENVRLPSRNSEGIAALTQTEGDLQRSQNDQLVKSFTDMQVLVKALYELAGEKLGVPILRSAN